MPRHTPKDSLTYLGNELDLLIGAAQEEIAGINLPDAPDDEDLPEHVINGLEMLDHALNILRYEVELHRARTVVFSTGHLTQCREKEPIAQEREDGITEITTQTFVYHQYPDGQKLHPIARKSPAKK